ncbi:unnamed protein product [Oncorhynchus mykiss]|uniref:Uncharacterized protein n=1 Tax=Oncorhynchus mykiss TaxID=8022 RepID=A0A060W5F1_ONCMY|nr:unnamed protein product [Oncorhynchus mykiss]
MRFSTGSLSQTIYRWRWTFRGDFGSKMMPLRPSIRTARLVPDTPVLMVRKYIVYEDCLLQQLFQSCPVCTKECEITKQFQVTLICIAQICPHCDNTKMWTSTTPLQATST